MRLRSSTPPMRNGEKTCGKALPAVTPVVTPSSSEVRAAVHVEDLAGDLPRLVGGQEHDGGGDLGGLHHATERYLARPRGELLFAGAVAWLRRVGQPGRDGIDADAVR